MKMMKKVLPALFAIALCFGLAACGSPAASRNSSPASSAPNSSSTPVSSTPESSSIPESSVPESSPPVSGAPESGSSEPSGSEPSSAEPAPEPEETASKILVAYFSATNTTKTLAEYLAEGLGADLYAIVPEEPYTSADLNYRDDNSRSTREMNDPASRPAISGSVENMGQYDTVVIAYPIWWGEAPRIVDTFVESYDFSGKTIIPFCTSGGSGIGSSAKTLETLAGGGSWLEGRRFSGGESKDDMLNWFGGLEIED